MLLSDDSRETCEALGRALDIDAGLRMGNQHVGPKRSPLHDTEDVLRLARHITERAGFTLVGVMTYEGQVAGVPDDVPSQRAKSLVVRRLKSASMAQLAERRRVIADRLADLVELEFWNGGFVYNTRGNKVVAIRYYPDNPEDGKFV